MKLLLIADGRSPITRRWLAMLQPLGHEVVLVSSYPCKAVEGVVRLHILPLAFADKGGSQAGEGPGGGIKKLVGAFRPLAQRIRHLLGPWMLAKHVNEYLAILEQEKPDLVHALRIPFEGMLASHTPPGIPVLVSTWGNDLTLHAPSTLRMSAMTRRALQRVDGLLSDTQRDAALALEWGFDAKKPALVVPGNGGIDLDEIFTITRGIERTEPPQVINPRGLRSYVRTDTFFKAVPLVLARRPDVQFACASQAGQVEAKRWVQQLGIEKNIRLLPFLSQPDLWREYARSQVSVSISTHDGTPNSLLEAMSLGCLPICGDIESIREWITDGENGLLVDPADPFALAGAILKALDNHEFQQKAGQKSLHLIRTQADLDSSREKVKEFYARFA